MGMKLVVATVCRATALCGIASLVAVQALPCPVARVVGSLRGSWQDPWPSPSRQGGDVHAPWKDNPYQPAVPSFGNVENRVHPVAPYSDVIPGIEAQNQRQGLFGGRAEYFPAWEDQPGPFPKKYDDGAQGAAAAPRGKAMECVDFSYFPSLSTANVGHPMLDHIPAVWEDNYGNSCLVYERKGWCNGEARSGANPDPGGHTAAGACCACGGGLKTLVAVEPEKPIGERRLVAPEDRLPAPKTRWSDDSGPPALAAHLDGLPLQNSPVAPEDVIPIMYSRYLTEVNTAENRPDVMGLSARFYSVPPVGCAAKPAASVIDRALDYGIGFSVRSLATYSKDVSNYGTGVFWAKWTGTVEIFTAGTYVFNLDVGFNTHSLMKVDGLEMITRGQCRISSDEERCKEKKCVWVAMLSSCFAPGSPDIPAAAFLQQGQGQAQHAKPLSSERSLQKASLLAAGQHAQQQIGFGPAPAAYGMASPVFAPSASPAAVSASAPSGAVMTAPAPAAPAAAPSGAAAPAASPAEPPPASPAPGIPAFGVPTSGPGPIGVAGGPDAALLGGPGEIWLPAGGHCIEAVVMATDAGKTVKLKYAGPDTEKVETIVPGQALFCDPVIPACSKPSLDACARFTPTCPGPMDVHFPVTAVVEQADLAQPMPGALPMEAPLPHAGVSPGPAPQVVIPIPVAEQYIGNWAPSPGVVVDPEISDFVMRDVRR